MKNTWAAKNTWGVGVTYVLGSEIPSTGDDGPALFYESLILPDDENKQYRFEEVQDIEAPATIDIDLANTAATVDSTGVDGTYTYQFRAYEKDGSDPEVDLGVVTATFIFSDNVTAVITESYGPAVDSINVEVSERFTPSEGRIIYASGRRNNINVGSK